MSANKSKAVNQKFEEKVLHCQICTERFDQIERLPKALSCQHTFCLPCLTTISRSSQGMLKCPVCSKTCHTGLTCQELPTDHRVTSLLDWMSQANTKPQNICSKHTGERIFFVCETCIVPVCRQCTVLDHKESNGHTITEISQVLTKLHHRLRNSENNSRAILKQLQTKSGGLKKSMKALDVSKAQHTNEIKQKFATYRSMLDDYEKKLLTRECQRSDHHREILQAQHDSVNKQTARLPKLHDDVLSEEKDVTKLCNTVHEMLTQENYLKQMSVPDEDSLDQIIAKNKDAFRSDMRSVEKIWSRSQPKLEDVEKQKDRLLQKIDGLSTKLLNLHLPKTASLRFFFAVLLHVLGTAMYISAVDGERWTVTKSGRSLGLRRYCDGDYCYAFYDDQYIDLYKNKVPAWQWKIVFDPILLSLMIDCLTLFLAFIFMFISCLWKRRSFKCLAYVMTFTLCVSQTLKFIGLAAWWVYFYNPKHNLGQEFYKAILSVAVILGAGLLATSGGSNKTEKD